MKLPSKNTKKQLGQIYRYVEHLEKIWTLKQKGKDEIQQLYDLVYNITKL